MSPDWVKNWFLAGHLESPSVILRVITFCQQTQRTDGRNPVERGNTLAPLILIDSEVFDLCDYLRESENDKYMSCSVTWKVNLKILLCSRAYVFQSRNYLTTI